MKLDLNKTNGNSPPRKAITQFTVRTCIACGKPVQIPFVGVKHPHPSRRTPLCNRPKCIRERTERLELVRKGNKEAIADAKRNVDTSGRREDPVEIETLEGPVVHSVEKIADAVPTPDLVSPDPEDIEKLEESERQKCKPARADLPAAPRQPSYLKSVPQIIVPSADPAAPYGRDEDDKPIVPMRSDTEIANDIRERWQRYIAIKPQCVHHNDADCCVICGTKRIAPPTQVALNWNVVPGSEKARPMTSEEQSAVWERNACNYFGLKPQAPPTPREAKPKPIKSYRTLLNMSRDRVLALFNPDRIVDYKNQLVEEKILMDKTSVEDQVRDLRTKIKEQEDLMATRSKIWWRRHHPEEIPPDRKTFASLKYADQKEITVLERQLRVLRERLRNWESDPRNYKSSLVTKQMPVTFADKYPITYQKVETDSEFVQDRFRKQLDGCGYYTELLMIVETPVGGIYDLEGYKKVVQLNAESLQYMTGNLDWSGWEQWENAVIIAAIQEGLIRPDKNLIEIFPGLGKWMPPYDPDDDADYEAEENLIRKTGGGALGGATICSRGWRVGKHGNTLRKLDDFDATLGRGAGKGRPGANGEDDTSYTPEDQDVLEPN